MDHQDEWLQTLRYANNAQDKISVDTLMLRYRPIAPKPTTPTKDNHNINNSMSKRNKRKYVRVSKNNRGKSRSDISNDREKSETVTLQLLPEKSDQIQDPAIKTIIEEKTQETDTCTIFNGGVTAEVETWVTVESVITVTDGGSSSSFTDIEMVDSLSKDTCPAFISDGLNRVVWINEAYRRNISGEDSISSSPPEVTVWLVVEEESTMSEYCNYKAFTCRVKMQYTWQETKYTKTAPCDVWRMEFGGFAWRLDTTAALTHWL